MLAVLERALASRLGSGAIEFGYSLTLIADDDWERQDSTSNIIRILR